VNIYKDLSENTVPSAVALGYFDGMHRGHQKVISTTVNLKKYFLRPTVFTFSKNPKSIVSNTSENQIMDIVKKEESLEKLGIEDLYIVDFLKIKDLTPREFVKNVLIKKLNAHAVVCGFNYHFGKGGVAGAEDLKKICKEFNIKTYIVKPVLYKSKPISSTRIRKAIKFNNISQITDMTKNATY